MHPDKGGDKEAFQELQRAHEEILAERGRRTRSRSEGDEEEEEDWEEAFEREREERKRRAQEARKKEREAERKRREERKEEEERQRAEEAERKKKDGQGDDKSIGEDGGKEMSKGGEESAADEDDDEEDDEDDGDEDGIGGADGTGIACTDPDEEAQRAKEVKRQRAQRQKQRRALKKLMKEVREAADCAGEHAMRTLRHCNAGMDAVEKGAKGLVETRASAAAAVEEASRVATAAKSAGECAGTVAGILEQLTEEHAVVDDNPNPAEEIEGKSTTRLEDATQTTAEASLVANHAAATCASAVVDATKLIRSARCAALAKEAPIGTLSPELAMLERAIGLLMDTAKAAAVAAIEAADAAEEAHVALDGEAVRRAREKAEEASGLEVDSSEELKSAEEEACEQKKREAEAAAATRSQEEQRAEEKRQAAAAAAALEHRRTVADWLEVHRVLHRANKDVLDLQRQARCLERASTSRVPVVPKEQRTRVFALLAEFLDIAALDFHSSLQSGTSGEALPGAGVPASPVVGSGLPTPRCAQGLGELVRAAEVRALDFLLTTEAGLAVSVDPRAQVLRAAAALDIEVVREMVEGQLLRRLAGSVTFVRSGPVASSRPRTAACDAVPPIGVVRAATEAGGAPDGVDEALEGLRGHLVAALASLTAPASAPQR